MLAAHAAPSGLLTFSRGTNTYTLRSVRFFVTGRVGVLEERIW